MTPQQLTPGTPTPDRSVLRHLRNHGIGTVIALVYWGVVAAMVVVEAVFLLAFGGPFVPLLWAVLCVCAYGFGLLLCAVAGLLTISQANRRNAVAFLLASAAANIGLVLLVAVLAAGIKLALSPM